MSCPPAVVPDFSCDSDNGGSGGSGVQTVSGGTNITVSGTATDPVINNNGVLGVSAGTNISITGTANNPIINSLVASTPVGIFSSSTVATTTLTTSNQIILSITFTLTKTCNLFITGGLGLISTSTSSARVIMGFNIDTAPIPNTTVSQTIHLQGSGTVYERVSTTGFTNRPAGTYTLTLRAYAAGVANGTVTLDAGTNTLQLLTNLA